ncbi:hypothetical protein BD560DRAFT_428520 [Blakeslea trispora]|nr:hypothetical protein BD560DRAFT_428520 [Blakeslea trispora]
MIVTIHRKRSVIQSVKKNYKENQIIHQLKSCFHFIVIWYTSVKLSSSQRVAMDVITFDCSYFNREYTRPFQQYMSFSILVSLTSTCIIIRLDIGAISYIFYFKETVSMYGLPDNKEQHLHAFWTANGNYHWHEMMILQQVIKQTRLMQLQDTILCL